MNWQEAAELTKRVKAGKAGDNCTLAEKAIAVLILGAFLLFFGVPLIVYVVWANALAIKVLWGWFVVSTFGLSALSWGQAWGLSMIVAYLTHQWTPWKAKDERETYEKVLEFVVLIFKPWIAIAFGWVCYHYFIAAT